MNIKNIAKLSGYSTSTVSRYLNDGKVSKKAKEKISKIIEETGYIPLDSARDMRGKSNKIMIIVQRINSVSASRLLDKLINNIKKEGFTPVIYTTNFNKDEEINNIKYAKAHKYYGVIVYAHSEFLDDYEEFKHMNLIILSQYSNKFKYINYNSEDIFYELTKNVYENNFIKNIVSVGVDQNDIGLLKRVEGTKKYCKEKNIAFSTLNSTFDNPNIKIDNKPNKTYYCCVTDAIAIDLMLKLNSLGYKMREDYFISGVGDYPESKILDLTTIQTDFDDLAKKTIHMLINKDSNSIVANKNIINVKIIYRKST